MTTPEVRIRSWVRASDEEQRSGLLGYLSLFYGDLILDGATIRRTAAGKLTISWPQRRDGQGRKHAYIRPIDDAARRAIEAAVFGQATLASEAES